MEGTQSASAQGGSAVPPAPKEKTAAAPAAGGARAVQPRAPGKVQGQPPPGDDLKSRRWLVWSAVTGFLGINFLMFLRFFFPRTLFEPSSKFRIGSPAEFGLGVDERFKQSHRIWVVRQPDKMFVIFAKCTHLGCTPNWIESENKFKCPCHGSGYDTEGRNFEGPAPRPMDRTYVELDPEGQIVVDTSRLYQCAPGAPCHFDADPNSFLVVS